MLGNNQGYMTSIYADLKAGLRFMYWYVFASSVNPNGCDLILYSVTLASLGKVLAFFDSASKTGDNTRSFKRA